MLWVGIYSLKSYVVMRLHFPSSIDTSLQANLRSIPFYVNRKIVFFTLDIKKGGAGGAEIMTTPHFGR